MDIVPNRRWVSIFLQEYIPFLFFMCLKAFIVPVRTFRIGIVSGGSPPPTSGVEDGFTDLDSRG